MHKWKIYEDKKVDYLVATDAIGMGLNLNINHVSFLFFYKNLMVDIHADLYPSEIGQIAGRAGRYQNDGTFSFAKEAGSLDPLIVQSIEDHQLCMIFKKIYWRNSSIDFSSLSSAINSFRTISYKKFFYS